MPRLPFTPPVESLRCGGLPADAFDQAPPLTADQFEEAFRDYAGELKAGRGKHEDGTPRVAAVDSGGRVHLPHIRKVAQCPDCELQYIDEQHLAAHREADHQGDGAEPG